MLYGYIEPTITMLYIIVYKYIIMKTFMHSKKSSISCQGTKAVASIYNRKKRGYGTKLTS